MCELLECPESLRGLTPLYDKLSKLRVDMVGLSDTRRPGSGETSSKGFTYNWFGMSKDHHVKGVAKGVSSAVCCRGYSVDKRIMRLRLKHSMGFMFVVAVYAPTEVCETYFTGNHKWKYSTP